MRDSLTTPPDVLLNRAAILSACECDGRVLPVGSLGVVKHRGAAIRVRFDEGVEHDATECGLAEVRADGALPRQRQLSVLMSAIVGSRAHGLNTDESDHDRRGFFVAGSAIQFSLDGPPQQIVHDGDQLCYWETGKFLHLALKANPTVLEALYSPAVEFISPIIADDLLRLRDRGAFLSRLVHQTFMGYADSQFQKMTRARERGLSFKWQHAMHLIRLLHAGIQLVRERNLDVMVPADRREELLAIKSGRVKWRDVCARRDELVAHFNSAAANSQLPERPDVASANALLMSLRLQTATVGRA